MPKPRYKHNIIVSVVVTGKERDELLTLCEDVEEESGSRNYIIQQEIL